MPHLAEPITLLTNPQRHRPLSAMVPLVAAKVDPIVPPSPQQRPQPHRRRRGVTRRSARSRKQSLTLSLRERWARAMRAQRLQSQPLKSAPSMVSLSSRNSTNPSVAASFCSTHAATLYPAHRKMWTSSYRTKCSSRRRIFFGGCSVFVSTTIL